MLLVFTLAAAIWAGGAYLGAPREQRVTFLAGLFFVVLALQIVLPETHPLRQATGGDPALWMLFGGFVLLWLAYRQVLRVLRRRVEPVAQTPPKPETFSQTELNRYARHIVLRELGGPGQKALREAKVLVVGAGGLGAPALQYLAAAGVGTIGVIDDDVVDGGNLQRQVIHRDEDIGVPKVFSAQAAMQAQNPFIEVRPYHRRLTEEIAAELIAEYDLVLDGCDNFETRYLVNRVCVEAGKPLILGALSQWEGQLSVFDPSQGGPCYACVFPQAPAPGLAPSCAEAGVLGPLPGVVGSMMAVEAIKLIAGTGTSLRGKMMIYDALHGENRVITLKNRPDCPVCGTAARRAVGK